MIFKPKNDFLTGYFFDCIFHVFRTMTKELKLNPLVLKPSSAIVLRSFSSVVLTFLCGCNLFWFEYIEDFCELTFLFYKVPWDKGAESWSITQKLWVTIGFLKIFHKP